jgi:pilus assembly protein CpaE
MEITANPQPEPDAMKSATLAVPRISIQAFCDLPETAEILQVAANDRRLSRAHTTIQMGGGPGAIAAFSNVPTPNLIIIETRADRNTILAELNQLAQVCDVGTKVVVIGHMNDVVLYRALIKDGVSEYIVAPIDALQIIGVISNLYHAPDTAPLGRVLAFVGAKGGVGSSTLAHNVSWAIAQDLAQDTAILDLDLPFGTAGLNLNQDPPQGVAEALHEPDRLDDVLLDRLLTKCTDRLSLLASPGAIDRDYEFDEKAVNGLIDVIRANVPFVVVDIPHLWTPWAKGLLLQADEIVLTAVPDLANLRNAKNLLDVFKSARPNDGLARIILNQVGAPKRPEIGVDDFTSALEIEPSVILPYDPQVFGTAANNGQMIEEVAGNTKIAESFIYIAQLLTGRREEAAPKKSLFAPLMERFKGRKSA